MAGSGGGGEGEDEDWGEEDGGVGAGLIIIPEVLIRSVDCIRPIVEMPPTVTIASKMNIIGFPSLTAIYSTICLPRIRTINDYDKVNSRVGK